ncbi:MAG: DUF721 domain-containing protein [Pyrinomonadaceae bacterium]|nr:DUF721 domain-containing protein [Pyrinomonadaceae bacterium]
MDDLLRPLIKILRASGDSEEAFEAAAFLAWRRVAGEHLRTAAVPFRLYRKTLVVAVPDATWQKQLEAISAQMLFRINSLLGQAVVTYIEFRIDPQTIAHERERNVRMPPVERDTQEQQWLAAAQELRTAATHIEDQELRRRFLLAAGSSIDAQQRRREKRDF